MGYRLMGARITVADFELANPLYAGALVRFFQTDNDGIKTATLATLYAAPSGVSTLENPQTLDSDGKFAAPVYIEDPVIASISGITNVDDHDTGVIWAPGTWRGSWATATTYYPGDFFQAGANADSSNDVYMVAEQHTSGTFATDVAGALVDKVVDVSVIGDLFDAPDPSANANEFLRVNAGGTAYAFITTTALQQLLTALTTRGDIAIHDASGAARLGIGSANTLLISDGTDPSWSTAGLASLTAAAKPYDIGFVAGYDGDMVKEDIAVKVYGKVEIARPFTVTGEVSGIETAPTDAALIIDILKNGTSIYTTKPQYASGSTTLTAGTLKSDGTEVFAAGDTLTHSVTQVGSTEPGEGMTFTVIGELS
jgi:hypothetical protein